MKRLLATLVILTIACTADAAVRTKKIEYDHAGAKMQGHLAWDDAVPGKRPGVLVVHEWWGLNDYARHRAEQLAAMGYVAFAVDMYGGGKVTEHPREAGAWAQEVRANVKQWRERATAGLETLKKQENVDAARLAAIGYCFGGATVMELAYAGADLKGVVSFHGSLPLPEAGDTATIKSKILICHGAADSFIPEEQITRFRAALEKAGADWQMIYYAAARHSFTNPDADKHGLDGLSYNRDADQRSWQHMKALFDEIFTAK